MSAEFSFFGFILICDWLLNCLFNPNESLQGRPDTKEHVIRKQWSEVVCLGKRRADVVQRNIALG